MKKIIAALVILSFIIGTGYFLSKPTESSPVSPIPVFPLMAIDSTGKAAAIGNAVLVDAEKDVLFITNAHILATGGEYSDCSVIVNGESVYVRDRENWIDKKNDLAILYLPARAAKKFDFTKHLQINGAPVSENSVLFFHGYVPDEKKGIKPYVMKSVVVAVARDTEKKHVFINPENALLPGMSGSAVLDADGQLVGILGAEFLLHAVAIPSADIQPLIEKAKKDLQKETE